MLEFFYLSCLTRIGVHARADRTTHLISDSASAFYRHSHFIAIRILLHSGDSTVCHPRLQLSEELTLRSVRPIREDVGNQAAIDEFVFHGLLNRPTTDPMVKQPRQSQLVSLSPAPDTKR